jgi:hypothetical protein
MIGYNTEVEHTPIIREIVRLMGCETYLELGVLEGKTIREIVPLCKRCIGVDIADIRKFKDFEFHLMTTDSFFSTFDSTADVIFIDADHRFESVKKDFKNALSILNKFGVIILHDTDPIGVNYLKPDLCGDSYKMLDWIKANYYDLNILTLPVSVAGLTIVNRKSDRRVYDFL